MRILIVGAARCNRAVATVEYGLLVGCIALAIITGVQSLGGTTGGMWGRMSTSVVAALS